MIRKVLIMNRFENSKKETCGLLTLEQSENLNGRLRVYNLDTYNDLKLSLKIGENKLLFDNVTNPENFLFSTIYHNLNLPIFAALFSDINGKIHVAALGHTEGEDSEPDDMFDDYKNDKTLSDIKQMIDAEIDKQTESDGAESSVQTKNDDPQIIASSLGEENKETQEEISAKRVDRKDEFFDLIKPQVDELFSTFPHNKELEQKIENSFWVDISSGDESYVLGQIFDEGKVGFICYGIPADSMQTEPPKHLKKFCQWLPLSVHKPEDKGYWIMYQDAKTGENIIID